MPRRDDTIEGGEVFGRRGLSSVLTLAAVVVFAVLAGWMLFAALTADEPQAFAVAPPADAPAAVAAVVAEAQGADADAGLEPSDGEPATVPMTMPATVPATVPETMPVPVVASNAGRVDPAWAACTAAATGFPVRALVGYAGAELAMAAEAVGCGIRWSTLAALGGIESAHGTHAGSVIGADGVARPGIFGIDLTGAASARITDTDGGAWDGKADIDRAVGPMQFIPATWETWGADGNGDGVRDPQQIDDAAMAAAGYLCHSGDLSSPTTWRAAIFSYNHLDSYVNAVARAANEYAGRAG